MEKWTINKNVAPKKWTDFKRWYKAACNLPDVTAEEAFQSLGYKLPKKDVTDKPIEKKLKQVRSKP
jgi:hypothetical protein